jgi:hypothetical protein
LSRLEEINFRLRKNGLLAFIFTLANFVVLIICSSLPVVSDGRSSLPVKLSFLFPSLMALFSSGLFEMWRSEGDGLFDVISNELEWDARQKASSVQVTQQHSVFSERLLLKEFTRLSTMPLIPSRFGPAIYFAVNFLLALAQQYLLFVRM